MADQINDKTSMGYKINAGYEGNDNWDAANLNSDWKGIPSADEQKLTGTPALVGGTLGAAGGVIAGYSMASAPGVVGAGVFAYTTATGMALTTGLLGGAAGIVGGATVGVIDGPSVYHAEQAYKQLDSDFQPDPKNHSNLIGVAAQLTKQKHLDLTNPDNVKMLQEKMSAEETRLTAEAQASKPTFPLLSRYIQFTGTQEDTYEMTQADLRELQSAKLELGDYQQKLASHQQGNLVTATQKVDQLNIVAQLENAAHSPSGQTLNTVAKNNTKSVPSIG